MGTNNFSREYLFQKYTLYSHCICVELKQPLTINTKQHYLIYILEIEPNDISQKELLTRNCLTRIDTYGKLEVLAFVDGHDGHEFVIEIDTTNIVGIELHDR